MMGVQGQILDLSAVVDFFAICDGNLLQNEQQQLRHLQQRLQLTMNVLVGQVMILSFWS
jgi:hypothetical protein